MGQERRRFDHVPVAMSLTIIDEGTRSHVNGSSINLSRGGVGFYSERFLRPDTHVTFVFHFGYGTNAKTESIHATVRWSKIEGEGAIGGAAFGSLLSDATFPLLSDRLFAAL